MHQLARILSLFSRISRSKWIVPAIFVASLAVRLGIMTWNRMPQELFRGELQKTAESLATTGIYGNPYCIPTGPTAHVSPIYTLLTAGVFELFGIGIGGELALYLLGILLTAVWCCLLPVVAGELGFSRATGVLAGFFGALVPMHFLNEMRCGDAPLSSLLLMAVIWTTSRSLKHSAFQWNTAVLSGISWGASLLLLPSMLTVLVGLAVLGVILTRDSAWLKTVGVSASIAFLMLLPWAIRNRLVLGETVWFRSNFGLELRLAYNPHAEPDIDANRISGSFDQYHPVASEAAARAVLAEGETAYFRRMQHEAVNWIVSHPGESLRLTAQRVRMFWFPRTLKPLQSLVLSGLSILAIAGLLLQFRRSRDSAWLLATTWLTFPLVYYFVQSAVRYRYPMNWTLLLPAALAILALLEYMIKDQPSDVELT